MRYLKFTGQPLLVTRAGLLYSIAVGIAFSGVTILLYLTLARVSVSLGSPLIRALGIVIASLLGILVLHEPFTWRYTPGADPDYRWRYADRLEVKPSTIKSYTLLMPC